MAAVTTPTEIEVLQATKAYLQEHGWNQSQDWRGQRGTATCISNATHRAGGEANDHLMEDLYGMPIGTLFDWNDSKGRIVEEVYSLIDTRIAHFKRVGAE